MFEQIINNLIQSGWSIVTLESNWVCATHVSQQRGLLFGNFSELPQEFKPWIRNYANISQWDAVVFCPKGIDSSDLKQHRFPNVQLWYWDTQKGNLFPFPPTNDQRIPQWLRQLSSGEAVFLETNSQVGKHFVPFLTYTLLGINLIVFLLMTLAGGSTNQSVLIAFGAKVNTLIQAGQIWRFLTSAFIHIGIMHLVFNLYALWALGPLTEESFGHRRFLIIYILSALGGSIASFLFTTALSAGASGAIFGLLGALLYFSYKRPYLWKSGLGMNLIVVIFVNFGFGLLQPGIDNFAHLGGLLTGTITSMVLAKNNSKVT
ncbi:rhomboid family intramembrane serine protease [Desulfosporosinus metallidurans]|uniref:GlpG protein (Membrane protein of glp regulon) n=1 Tax=Desulfosporosinus metallidurans TaxID=1888891 RepID=A0A1Q8R1Y1_9FIRM|nr:rhomboid family intramembrane serine protease [Desulfosporosinus metallidurans]OLN33568.1 GlpG protein (membrane protein of glp regulon) [Desulfosporosinus metallidurans]